MRYRRWLLLVGVVALLLAVACQGQTATPTPGPSVGKKVVMVIAPQDFRDEEFSQPRAILQEKGITVVVASTTRDTARGMLGLTVKPDIIISEIDVAAYDAIVVVGGSGSQQFLWDNEALRKVVQGARAQGKVVAAICISPVVLARAGVLQGQKSTVFPSAETIEELRKGGAIYEDSKVVVSGALITGSGPEAARDFGYALVDKLAGR